MRKADASPTLGIKGSSLSWNQKAQDLATRVHKARTRQQMTPWQLAEQCSVSVGTIQDLERARPIEQRAVETVCRTLGLPVPTLDGDPVHTFALLVRQRREQARLRQYQLAALSGLSAKTIKEVERAVHWPRAETCVALLSVTALHLQPSDIAPFVSDLDAAGHLAQRVGHLAQVRIGAQPDLIARINHPDPDRDEPSGPATRTPNPMKPRPPLLFTLRVYVDGTIVFAPSLKAKRK